jgi:hypothetical protein
VLGAAGQFRAGAAADGPDPASSSPDSRLLARTVADRTVADRTAAAMAPQLWMRLFPGSYMGRRDTAAG